MEELFKEKLVAYRREFHKHPEKAWTEFRTSSRIAEILFNFGYKVFVGKEIIEVSSVMGRAKEVEIQRHIERAMTQGAEQKWMDRMDGYTGVVGILDTKKSGPVIALRFDIDANEAEEIEKKAHRPYSEGFSSVNKGVMHACGHDGHIAIGLGIAQVLMERIDTLCGKIKLIFQPAEEGVQGAKSIVNKGILDDVEYFISGHIGLGALEGEVVVNPSGFLPTTKFNVTYIGKGSHAGVAPNEGNNALLAAANTVLNLHAIPPHKDGITRINVGVLQAGTSRNVIAPKAFMEIETRGFTRELNQYMFEKAERIIQHSGQMYELTYELEKVGEAIEGNCDKEFVDLVESEAKKIEGITKVQRDFDFGASEDVTWMMKRVQERGGKAIYMIMGTSLNAQHHNEWFDFDEKVLRQGVELYQNVVFKIDQMSRRYKNGNDSSNIYFPRHQKYYQYFCNQ